MKSVTKKWRLALEVMETAVWMTLFVICHPIVIFKTINWKEWWRWIRYGCHRIWYIITPTKIRKWLERATDAICDVPDGPERSAFE